VLREELWRARIFTARAARDSRYKNNRRIEGEGQGAGKRWRVVVCWRCINDEIKERGPMIVRRSRLSSVPPFPAPSPIAMGQISPTGCSERHPCLPVHRRLGTLARSLRRPRVRPLPSDVHRFSSLPLLPVFDAFHLQSLVLLLFGAILRATSLFLREIIDQSPSSV